MNTREQPGKMCIRDSLSPWLSRCRVGDIHTVAVSHGEGRFVLSLIHI